MIHKFPHKHHHKHPILVTLTRTEITFDIDFETANVARNSMAGKELKDKKELVKAITGKETKDWLDRQIDTAYANLINFSAPFVDREHSHARQDWVDWERQTWDIALLMDKEWLGDVQTLTTTAHDYTTAYILSRWYAMVQPDRAAIYEDRAFRAKKQYRDELTKYKVPTQFIN